MEGLSEGDELEVEWNGRLLPWPEARVTRDGWTVAALAGAPFETRIGSTTEAGTLVELDAAAPLPRRGENRLRIRLVRKPGAPRRSVVLKAVYLDIEYRERA